MKRAKVDRWLCAGSVSPLAGLCLALGIASAGGALAQDGPLTDRALGGVLNQAHQDAAADQSPFQLFKARDGGLNFDLAGSETRKLELQLEQPLMLRTATQSRVMSSGANLLGLDATLELPVTDHFSVAAGANSQTGKARFQSLGSIQCMNGTLRPDSYTASGCRFVDEPYASAHSQSFKLGTQFENEYASASINWFTQTGEINQAGPVSPAGARASMSSSLLNPELGNPLFAPSMTDPLQQFNSEASGVDVNFQLGITTNQVGDIKLGLAFSRVLDVEYQGLYSNNANPMSWTVAEPFSTARMDLEWSHGAFSSGIQGYYRDSVDFLNREGLDSLATFDVHFTWRTPWNANLSVGASNVLNAGTSDAAEVKNQPVDPLESIYGRIPYVRYKQDL